MDINKTADQNSLNDQDTISGLKKRVYAAPRLVKYGPISSVTAGGVSFDVPDGTSGMNRPPFGPPPPPP